MKKFDIIDTGEEYKKMKVFKRRDVPVMCKECGKYTRRNGSAFCNHCANKYKEDKKHS